MLIYRCDSCGQEAQIDKIVGNEFEYLKHGYGSLAFEAEGKRDLCRSCMKVAERAYQSAHRQHLDRVDQFTKRAVASALSLFKPTKETTSA